jgi:hypothetical protein
LKQIINKINQMKKVIIGNKTYIETVVTQKLGAWKWARTRCRSRIVEIVGDVRGTDLRFSNVKSIWESGEYTMDYRGGRWGYGNWELSDERFHELVNSYICNKNLQKINKMY